MKEKKFLWKGPQSGDHSTYQASVNCLRSTILIGTDSSRYVNSVTWLHQRTTLKTCQKLLLGEYWGGQTLIGMDIWIIRSSNRWYEARTGISQYRMQCDTTSRTRYRHVLLSILTSLMLTVVFLQAGLYTRVTILAGHLLWGWLSSVL